jgi:uncharacterized protein (TIGR02246 family)
MSSTSDDGARAQVESDIEALYHALLRSWNEQDAAAYAALFAENGHVVGFDGSLMDGPAEIESTLRTIFAHHRTASYVAIVRDISLLAPDVALLQARAGMVPPQEDNINPAVNAIQSLVARQVDGRWRITLFQNTPAAFHGRPELVEQMTVELRDALRSPTAE